MNKCGLVNLNKPFLPDVSEGIVICIRGISPKTLNRKIQEAGIFIPKGNVYPVHQKIIYETLWYPNDETRNELKQIPPNFQDPKS